MKRILGRATLIAIGIFIGGFHEWTARADAALTCPGESLGTPAYLNGNLQESYNITCSGNKWELDFYSQYEVLGSWTTENCQNTSPCHIARPSDGSFYPANSAVAGFVNFATLNGCELRHRVLMKVSTPTQINKFSFASVASRIC